MTEYESIALLHFLAAARDLAVVVAYIDPWNGGPVQTVLVPLSSGVRREIDDIGLL